MAVKLVLKNSVSEDKRPNSAALGKGEISVNHHASGPFLSVVDSAGNVQQVAGVRIDPSAPSNPVRGTQWLNNTDQSLYFHDGSSWIKVAGSAGGGGGGGSVTLIGGDGIEATESGGVWTLDFDYDNTRGLSIDAGQAYVRLKPGGGLEFDNGEIAIDPSQSAGVDLSYKADGNKAGTVENTDGTDATIPIVKDAVAGLMTGTQKQKLDDIEDDAQKNIKPDWNAAIGDDAEILNKPSIPAATTVAGGTGIDVSTAGSTATVSVDVAADGALGFNGSDELEVKVGSGLTINGSNEIEAVGAMQYKGNVDLTSATVPGGVQNGWAYTNDTAGTASAEWGTACGSSLASGDAVKIGDYVIFDGTVFDYISTGSIGGTNITINEKATNVIVQSSTGTNDSIAAVSTTKAGVMLPAHKAAIDALPDFADGGGATADGRYVKLTGDALAQEITGSGGLELEGAVKSDVGFDIPTPSDWEVDGIPVSTGIFSNKAATSTASPSLSFVVDGQNVNTPSAEVRANTAKVFYVGGQLDNSNNSGELISAYVTYDNPSGVDHKSNQNYKGIKTRLNTDLKCKAIDPDDGVEKTFGLDVSAFNATVTANQTGRDVKGTAFNASFNPNKFKGEKSQCFNFHTTTSAPNFFMGDTFVGGSVDNSTFKTWLTTLTEEQEEEYRTGTFTIPDDVTNPGDGVWMRQWWYNQQTAENQALIDSGELDYPEHLQAANFTDTFALGDNTNIDLLSTGDANFAGSVDITGAVESKAVVFNKNLADKESPRGVAGIASIYLADSLGKGQGQFTIKSPGDYHVGVAINGIVKGTTDSNTALCFHAAGNLDGEAAANVTEHKQINSYINDVNLDVQTVTRSPGKLTHISFSTAYFNSGATANEVAGVRLTNALKSRKSDGTYTVPVTYGIKGELSDTTGEKGNAAVEVYHLYLNGQAPNFLAGNTFIGGSTARNTFYLWKSTLSEEQLEQYEAGRIAVPANVSNPGDGSYARQWWYDRQSQENQALIDAGELAYPTNLLPANFVDHFALGDNTAINLMSDGLADVGGISFNKNNSSAFVNHRGVIYSVSKNALLSVSHPDTPYTNCRVFLARSDNAMYLKGTRIPVPANVVTSFRADAPIGNADKQYGTYHGYWGFHATANNVNDNEASWTGIADCYGFYGGFSANRVGQAYVELTNGGGGFTDGRGTEVATSGGTGSGLTLNLVVKEGIIQGVNIKDFGSGYTEGDTLSINGYAGAEIVWHEPGDGKCYNVYSAGNADNFFRGKVGIGKGAENPEFELDIAGTALFKSAKFGEQIEVSYDLERPFASFLEINRDDSRQLRYDCSRVGKPTGDVNGRMIYISGSLNKDYLNNMTSSSVTGVDNAVSVAINDDDDNPINWSKKGVTVYKASANSAMAGSGFQQGNRVKNYRGVQIYRVAKLNFKPFGDPPPTSVGLHVSVDSSNWSEITYDSDGDPTDPADNVTKITLPKCWSIYSQGGAPSYHKSNFYFGTEEREPGKNNDNVGTIIAGGQANYMSNANGVPLTLHRTNAGTVLSFRNSSAHNADPNAPAGAEIGTVQINDKRIQITGLSGGPLIADLGADPRLVQSTAAIDDATAIVKKLQPAVINGSYHGFTAAALEKLVPAAVSGEADATEDIGTIFDFDGSVYATGELEPTPKELQYSVMSPDAEADDDPAPRVARRRTWKKTETRNIYQGVDQTKLIPLLTKALQEALERIEVLEATALGSVGYLAKKRPEGED